MPGCIRRRQRSQRAPPAELGRSATDRHRPWLPGGAGRPPLALPLLAVVLRLRRGGPRSPRRREGPRPRGLAHRSLQPVRRPRRRPRAREEAASRRHLDVFDLFATILAWFYAITHNYALAIALLTLCVMVVLTPLTLKGTKSMLQLQKLQPEIKRLQAEHKGDRQKLNEEMMALYKENRINPLSGCLPLLLQAPVFIILYRVLHGLTRHCPTRRRHGQRHDVQAARLQPGLHQAVVRAVPEPLQPDEDDGVLARPRPAGDQAAGRGLLQGLPYLLLVLLVGGAELLPAAAGVLADEGQRQPAAADDHEDPADRLRRLRADAAGRPDRVLHHVEPLPDRPAGLHHSEVLPQRGFLRG